MTIISYSYTQKIPIEEAQRQRWMFVSKTPAHLILLQVLTGVGELRCCPTFGNICDDTKEIDYMYFAALLMT